MRFIANIFFALAYVSSFAVSFVIGFLLTPLVRHVLGMIALVMYMIHGLTVYGIIELGLILLLVFRGDWIRLYAIPVVLRKFTRWVLIHYGGGMASGTGRLLLDLERRLLELQMAWKSRK